MKRLFLVLLLILSCSLPAWAAVTGHEVKYTAAAGPLHGYMVFDDAVTGKRPGILVVHEWWGQNEYVRKRARMLAELGYVALALDMYGEGKLAAHPDEAGKFAGEVRRNMDLGRQRFLAALKLLKEQPAVDLDRIAAIGYCFGGGVVLQMARDGVDLKGVVSFHGSLATDAPAEKGKVKAEILVCNGGADKHIPLGQIQSFIEEMVAAGVSFQFHSYPGALHSFTNPKADEFAARFNIAVGYNEQADRRSWQDMQSFFRRIFQFGE